MCFVCGPRQFLFPQCSPDKWKGYIAVLCSCPLVPVLLYQCSLFSPFGIYYSPPISSSPNSDHPSKSDLNATSNLEPLQVPLLFYHPLGLSWPQRASPGITVFDFYAPYLCSTFQPFSSLDRVWFFSMFHIQTLCSAQSRHSANMNGTFTEKFGRTAWSCGSSFPWHSQSPYCSFTCVLTLVFQLWK